MDSQHSEDYTWVPHLVDSTGKKHFFWPPTEDGAKIVSKELFDKLSMLSDLQEEAYACLYNGENQKAASLFAKMCQITLEPVSPLEILPDSQKVYVWPPGHTEVSEECCEMVWYVSTRYWGSDYNIDRLLRVDAENLDFDWDSVLRGEQDKELEKLGI